MKEEFWEDRNLEEEKLVKIDNFQSLRGSLMRHKRKPNSVRPDLLPETRTKGAVMRISYLFGNIYRGRQLINI